MEKRACVLLIVIVLALSTFALTSTGATETFLINVEAVNDKIDHLLLTDVEMFYPGIDETLTGIKDPYGDTTISATTDSGLDQYNSSEIDSLGEAKNNTTISATAGSELDESISSEIDAIK